MAESFTLVPVEKPLRDWLRGKNLAGRVGTRVYQGGLPDRIDGQPFTLADGPAVVLRRVAGSADGPVDRPLIQFDVWATSGEVTEIVEAALRTLLSSTQEGTAIATGLVWGGVNDQGSFWSPAPDSDRPRRISSFQIFLINTSNT